MPQLHALATGLAIVSGQVLVAAPAAGLKIVVDNIVVSIGTTAATVTLALGASNEKGWRFAASGHAEEFTRWEGDDGTALTVTTSANGPTDVYVDYHIERT